MLRQAWPRLILRLVDTREVRLGGAFGQLFTSGAGKGAKAGPTEAPPPRADGQSEVGAASRTGAAWKPRMPCIDCNDTLTTTSINSIQQGQGLGSS